MSIETKQELDDLLVKCSEALFTMLDFGENDDIDELLQYIEELIS